MRQKFQDFLFKFQGVEWDRCASGRAAYFYFAAIRSFQAGMNGSALTAAEEALCYMHQLIVFLPSIDQHYPARAFDALAQEFDTQVVQPLKQAAAPAVA